MKKYSGVTLLLNSGERHRVVSPDAVGAFKTIVNSMSTSLIAQQAGAGAGYVTLSEADGTPRAYIRADQIAAVFLDD